MKTIATRITERGQVSIPTEVRKQLHWVPGQRILWEVASTTECRVHALPPARKQGAQAMRGYAATFRKPRRTAEWMQEIREGETA
jgi:AbrB family looped-hinge helix DNA binding protein